MAKKCIWCDTYWICGDDPTCNVGFNPSEGTVVGYIEVAGKHFEVRVGKDDRPDKRDQPLVKIIEKKLGREDGDLFVQRNALWKKPDADDAV